LIRELEGRVAVIAGRPSALIAAIGGALAEAGADVRRIDPPDDPASAMAALATGPPPDVVAWADVDADALLPVALVNLAEADWVRRCEDPVRSTLWLVQAAHPHLRGRDGRLILVGPSVGLEGAALLVPLATAVEAQRLLAKSTARRWGADGVTVNIVTVPVTALDPALVDLAPDAARTEHALPTADTIRSAAAAVVWLAGAGGAGITGATIGADGGAVMAP
jgi:NAD(P)-dependent dehydrogenase (short-subunit alcohol dehydrogenase family)